MEGKLLDERQLGRLEGEWKTILRFSWFKMLCGKEVNGLT
jgi:hypothetical protein